MITSIFPMPLRLSAVLLVALCSSPALAHDALHPDFDAWYGSLQRPGTTGYSGGGVSCCSKKDCHPTDAELRGSEWWARLGLPLDDGEWSQGPFVHVPANVVITAHGNPTGFPVICHEVARTLSGEVSPTSAIYCFLPGFQT